MRFVSALLAALVLWLGASAARAGDAAAEAFYGPCRAEQVFDGESADVRCGDEVERVRLLDVNAPGRGEVGYSEAARALQQLLAGRVVWLRFTLPGQPTLDSDGRLLAHLYDAQGRNLNIELVRLGWATYASGRAADALSANFRTAQGEACASQRALWSVWSVNAGQLSGR